MTKHHVVDVLTETRTVRSLSGLDLGKPVELSISGRQAEILVGDLIDVKHAVGVPSTVGVKQPSGRWVWRQVRPDTKVRFTQS